MSNTTSRASRSPDEITKDLVCYRVGTAESRCGVCARFLPPAGCDLVAGQVSAQGACDRLATSRCEAQRFVEE